MAQKNTKHIGHSIWMTLIVWLFIGIGYISSNNVYAMPASFSVQYFITQPLSDGTFLPINGEYNITLHLIGDNPDTPLLSQKYKKSVREGLLTLDIEVTDPSIFTNNQLKTKLLITNLSTNAAIEQLNTTQTSDTAPPVPDELTVSLYAKTHSKVSYSSNLTQNFYNPRLLQIQYAQGEDDSAVSFNVTVGTTNATEKLTVDGTLKAHGFIGDGSGIKNINLLRWSKGDDTIGDETIYYIDGPVGMGTETPSPSAELHIASDTGTPTMQINQNIEIRNSLESTFYGDVLNVSSFNAAAFTTGTVPPNRLIGSYPKITGLGTLTTGYWHGQIIDKAYIANDLTIENSAFNQPNLQGTLNISALFSLKNPVFPLTIQSRSSTLSDHPSLNSIVFSSTTLNVQTLTFKDPFYISNISNPLLSINTSGNISIGNIAPLQALNVNGGMIINSSTIQELGIIRYTSGTGFSGYSFDGPTKKWKLFNKKIGNFTGHSLFPEYETSFDKHVLSIDAQGHIGIGMQPQNTQDVSIAGNVVFLSSQNTPLSFTSPPSQDSLVWAASKGAFRVGRNSLSTPFGYGSVALGVSTNATSTGSISINFGNTTTSGDHSVTLGSGNSYGILLNNPFNNTTILASDKFFDSNPPPSFSSDPIGNDSVVLSSSLSHISGTNNILISTFLKTPLVNNNSVIFGTPGDKLTGNAIGDHSFIFLSDIHKDKVRQPTHTNHDHSFTVFGNVGINQNNQKSAALSVNGIFYADTYKGFANLSNINAHQLHTMFGPVKSSQTTSPNSIYASNNFNTLPTDVVDASSITNNTIQSIDIKPYSIVSRNIAHDTLTKKHLADNSITNIHFKDNSLFGDIFSNITSKNFYHHVANHEKLATNSINITHFTDRVIPKSYLRTNIINSTNMLVNNIAPGGVHLEDLLPGELYNSVYFATANISAFHITKNALLNRHITSKSIASLHIANHAIIASHITNNAITSSKISDNAVVSRHFTTDDYVATQQTLTNNVFIGRHFNDRVLKPRMFTQTSFKVAADQFVTPAILSKNISSNAILSSHVSDAAINSGHVSSNAITSAHIINSSLTSINFSASAITSSNILDRSLTHNDIAQGAIQGIHFIPETITANHIATDAITNTHIGTKQISSQLLTPNTIMARHISNRALTSSKFQKSAITSNNISTDTIASTNLQALVITSKNNEAIASNSINWSHISGYLPINRIPALTASKLSLGTASITSKHIQENAITETKFALDFKISDADISKLQLPISIDQGGTGLTESDYKSDAILFLATTTNTTFSGYYFGQDPNFAWKDNRLLIASPNISNLKPSHNIVVSGNVQIIGGVTITQDNTSSYNIVLDNDYLQFTSGNITTGNDSNILGIKAQKLYLKDALYVGTSGPCISNCSSVVVSGNVAIGSSFISKPAPSNGLLIEDSFQIGTTNKKGTLNVAKTILAESFTASPIIVSDITNAAPSIKTGLKATEAPITSHRSITGMRIAGPIGGTVTVQKNTSTFVTGIKLSVDQGTALIVSLNATASSPTINAYLGHISNGKKHGVYGIAPPTTNAYAAYFNNGGIYAKNLDINVADTTPPAALRTSNLYHEDGPIMFNYSDINVGNNINWDKHPIAHIIINSSVNRPLQFTSPKHSSFLLLKIKYVSNGTGAITFPSTVTWDSNWANNPAAPKIQSGEGVEHIIQFYFDKPSNKYYGSIGYNFK